MKRFVWVLSVLALGAYGCDSGGGGGGDGDDCDSPCTRSNQCAVGEYCEAFCCAPLTLCTPTSCGANQFCDDDGTCKSLGEKCAFSTCECVIANTVGQFPPEGSTDTDPTVIELPADSAQTLQIALAEAGGSPLPGGGFTLSVDDTTYFDIDAAGTGIVSTSTAGGPTTLTATSVDDSNVKCYAELTNLGLGNGVRFHVFDDLTGAPIANAVVAVDADDDGVDDNAGSLTTDADGRVETTVSGTYSVHVFAQGYNYMSVIGLTDIDGSDIALPLGARAATPEAELVGGFTGRLGFEDYEDLFLAGTAKAIKFGIVASSFPLSAILNFDLSLFIGDFNLDVDCNANPSAAGCYDINIPGVVDTTAPLPGGVVLALASTAIKSHFDVIAKHGRRYGWGLGGEIEVQDIAPLIDIVTPLLSCSCDDTADVCDAGCTCDSDCPDGGQIDIGQVFNGLVPLFVNFASAAQGNLPLPPVTKADWNAHISDDYLQRFDDADFPKLDSGTTYGKMQLRQGLSTFTNYAVPNLPADPLALPTATVQTMEGMLVVTGVNAEGYGFVPLGIGAALDCTVGDCLDPDAATDAGVFDGKVNGGQMCVYDPDPELNGCPQNVPENTTDGHIGLFSAAPHAGLEGQEQMTLAIALPLSSIADGPIRVTAFVDRTPPQNGDQSLSGTFPTAPTLATIEGRTYTVTSTVEYDAHWLTFASDENNAGSTARWNVYVPGGAGSFTFKAPAVPATWDDPLTDNCCADPGTADGFINMTHVTFRLDTLDEFADYARHDGTSFINLVDAVDGFAVTSADVVVNVP